MMTQANVLKKRYLFDGNSVAIMDPFVHNTERTFTDFLFQNKLVKVNYILVAIFKHNSPGKRSIAFPGLHFNVFFLRCLATVVVTVRSLDNSIQAAQANNKNMCATVV